MILEDPRGSTGPFYHDERLLMRQGVREFLRKDLFTRGAGQRHEELPHLSGLCFQKLCGRIQECVRQ
jgi:hypothetical protein